MINFKKYLVSDLTTLHKSEHVIVVVTESHTGRKYGRAMTKAKYTIGTIIMADWYFVCMDDLSDFVCVSSLNDETTLYLRKDSILVYKIDWYMLYPEQNNLRLDKPGHVW